MSLSSRSARKQLRFAPLTGARPHRLARAFSTRARRVGAGAAAVAAGTVLLPRLALAQTYTYTGAVGGTPTAPVTGTFSTGFTPTFAAPGSTTSLLAFGGTTGYTAVDDLSGTVTVNGLSFTNTGAVNVAAGTGTSLTLGGTTPTLSFNNTGGLTIGLSFVESVATLFNGSGSATITGGITGNNSLTYNGTGTLTLAGATNTLSNLFVKTGTLVLSGATTTTSSYSSVGAAGGDNGTLTLTGAASLNGVNQDFNISDLVNSTGTVNLNSTGTLTTAQSYIGKGNATNATQGGTGTLNISSGTFISSILHLGSYGTSTGAINQTGGTVTLTSGDTRIGGFNGPGDVNAYGIWNLSAGTVSSPANTQFGAYGTGYLNQTGGTFNFGTSTTTGAYVDAGRFAGSYGVIDVSGGTFSQTNTGTRLFAGENGFGIITVRGVGAITSAGGIVVGNGGTTAGGIVNIDGGTLNAAFINTSATASTLGSLVNFNGGTLRPTAATATFLTGLGAAYVYNGNAIFDSNTFNITVAQPLLAPTGNGVSAVTVTSGGSGYVNAPVVKISGGGGTGATAVATVSGGVVTGITITNPGVGYTGQPTFTLVGGQANGTGAAFTATLAANTSGGLIKNGSGTLTLTGANTYAGGTTFNGGTVAVAADNILGAVPATPTTNLTFNGGALQATATFSLNANRNIAIGANGATTQVGGNTLTIPGTITSTAAGTALKTTLGDTGTLVLSGSNSFVAGSNVQITGSGAASGGILRLANSNALGTNAITINDSLTNNGNIGMVQLSGGITIPGTVTLTAAGHNQTTTDADLLRNVSGNNTFNGAISIIQNGGGYYIDSAAGAGTLLTLGGSFQNNFANSTRGPVFYGNGNTTDTGNISNGSATAALTSVGAGAANFVNTGVVTISGNNTYTGGTTAFSGTLRSGSATAVPAGTALAVGAIGTFDLNGQYLTPMGTAGAGLSLTMLGLTSGGTLNFNLGGSASDQLTFTGAVTSVGGKISIGAASGATGLTPGTYTLITDGAGDSSGFSLVTTNLTVGSSAYPLTLNATTSAVTLIVGTGVLGTAYWTGSQDNVWSTVGAGGATNFSTDAAGNVNANALPTSVTDVFFTAANATNFANVLGQDFTIRSLTMGVGAGAANATTIGGTNTLTINATTGGTYGAGVGIVIPAANTAAQTISSNVALGASQSWANNSTGLFTVSGNVSGAFALTLAGTGTTVLSGNNTYSGGTTISGGTKQIASATALGAATNALTVSGGTLDLNGQNVTQSMLTLSGGTVGDTAGGANLNLTSTNVAINIAPPPVTVPVTPAYGATTATATNNFTLNGGVIAKTTGSGTPVFTGNINLGGTTTTFALADSPGDPAAELSLTGVISNGTLNLTNNVTGTGLTFGNQLDYGTLLLSGNNTYAGGTNVNYGRIIITNGNALGTGLVTLAQSATPTTGGTLTLGNTGYTATSSPLALGTIGLGITVPNAINFGGPTSGNYGYGISNNNGANTLSGAITLTNANQIINVAGGSLALTGNIGQTVTATLTKNGANTLTLAPASGTANTYTGGTVIAQGELLFAQDNYLGTGTVTLSNTIVNNVVVGSGILGYTGATETFSLPFAATNAGGGGFDVVNANTNFTIPNYASTGTLQKYGAGTLTLGTTTTASNTLFHAGTVVIPTGGTLTNTNYTSIGTNGGDNATLTANGNYTVPSDFNVSDNTGSNGVLNINTGAVVKGTTTYIGKGGTATGVVNQTGGSYQQTGAGDFQIGGNASTATAAVGTYNISGGTLTTNSNFQVGDYGTGALNISGTGAVTDSAGFTAIGRYAGGFGVVDVSGTGSFSYTGGNRIIVGEQGNGVLNIRGNGTVTSSGSALQFGGGETPATGSGILNLDGGTLTTAGISQATSVLGGTANFNGGTLRSNASSTTFINGITNAYVYSGGATIDTNGFNDTIPQVLQTPNGNGLTAVTVTNGGSGYQTAPVIQISGGGGTGATAIATVSGGVITGITITNPGVGYTSTPTVTVISGANAGYTPTGGAAFSTAIAANTSGGLTKVGNGALTLTGANTFSGGVTVNAGSVIAGGTAVGTGGVTVASGATLGVGEALNGTTSAITTSSLSASTLAVTLGSTTPLLTFNLGAPGTNDMLNLNSTTATDLTYSGAGVFDIGFASSTGSSLGMGTYTLINFANPESTSTAPAIGAYQAVPQGNLGAINGGTFNYVTNGGGNITALTFSIGGSADALPEPGSIALTLLGLAGPIALIARRRKQA